MKWMSRSAKPSTIALALHPLIHSSIQQPIHPTAHPFNTIPISHEELSPDLVFRESRESQKRTVNHTPSNDPSPLEGTGHRPTVPSTRRSHASCRSTSGILLQERRTAHGASNHPPQRPQGSEARTTPGSACLERGLEQTGTRAVLIDRLRQWWQHIQAGQDPTSDADGSDEEAEDPRSPTPTPNRPRGEEQPPHLPLQGPSEETTTEQAAGLGLHSLPPAQDTQDAEAPAATSGNPGRQARTARASGKRGKASTHPSFEDRWRTAGDDLQKRKQAAQYVQTKDVTPAIWKAVFETCQKTVSCPKCKTPPKEEWKLDRQGFHLVCAQPHCGEAIAAMSFWAKMTRNEKLAEDFVKAHTAKERRDFARAAGLINSVQAKPTEEQKQPTQEIESAAKPQEQPQGQPQQQPNTPSERTAVGKTPTLPEESPLSLRQILGQLNVLREKIIDLITDDKAREGMNEKATSVLNLVARETKSLTDGVKTLMARERTEKAAASSNKATPAQTARGAPEGKMSYAMAARSQKQAQKETQKEARAKCAFIDRQPEQEQPRLWLASIAAKPDPKKVKMVSGLVENEDLTNPHLKKKLTNAKFVYFKGIEPNSLTTIRKALRKGGIDDRKMADIHFGENRIMEILLWDKKDEAEIAKKMAGRPLKCVQLHQYEPAQPGPSRKTAEEKKAHLQRFLKRSAIQAARARDSAAARMVQMRVPRVHRLEFDRLVGEVLRGKPISWELVNVEPQEPQPTPPIQEQPIDLDAAVERAPGASRQANPSELEKFVPDSQPNHEGVAGDPVLRGAIVGSQ
ncbi:uncharacterized protein BJ171DRAFT_100176 [Polychytrium aggregatum]|uniref:uncharacterized protein n=1 Tax=Polychytrium aggregatum TaxID=110093 RepID=UPI0022FF3AFA|nr:uncharacterized protein BJ171DRAFT_100176 [Polychytrium aggregatum]KAI9204711.1 hypothetical protein BJ171DRAFT_100176 [Polychytrium aggregatum]